jgi:hypothetical protein
VLDTQKILQNEVYPAKNVSVLEVTSFNILKKLKLGETEHLAINCCAYYQSGDTNWVNYIVTINFHHYQTFKMNLPITLAPNVIRKKCFHSKIIQNTIKCLQMKGKNKVLFCLQSKLNSNPFVLLYYPY